MVLHQLQASRRRRNEISVAASGGSQTNLLKNVGCQKVVSLSQHRRSRGACAACGSSLCIKQTEYIHSTFDVGRSMFIFLSVSYSINLAASAAKGWSETRILSWLRSKACLVQFRALFPPNPPSWPCSRHTRFPVSTCVWLLLDTEF
jgi:hypothetical protein